MPRPELRIAPRQCLSKRRVAIVGNWIGRMPCGRLSSAPGSPFAAPPIIGAGSVSDGGSLALYVHLEVMAELSSLWEKSKAVYDVFAIKTCHLLDAEVVRGTSSLAQPDDPYGYPR